MSLDEMKNSVRGLVFISDGSRGADKVAEALRQRETLLAAVEEVLAKLDTYPTPGKQVDPTGEVLGALESLEVSIRMAIDVALEGNR